MTLPRLPPKSPKLSLRLPPPLWGGATQNLKMLALPKATPHIVGLPPIMGRSTWGGVALPKTFQTLPKMRGSFLDSPPIMGGTRRVLPVRGPNAENGYPSIAIPTFPAQGGASEAGARWNCDLSWTHTTQSAPANLVFASTIPNLSHQSGRLRPLTHTIHGPRTFSVSRTVDFLLKKSHRDDTKSKVLPTEVKRRGPNRSES